MPVTLTIDSDSPGVVVSSATTPGPQGPPGVGGGIVAVPAGLDATGAPSASTFLRGDGIWAVPPGSGGGDLLAANNLDDLTNAATARTNLGLAIGTNVQAYSAILAATTASFLTAQETKLGHISVTQAVDLDAIETSAGTALQPAAIGVTVQGYDADLAALATAGNSGVLAATTASFLTAQETKLGHISVTQAVDLDTIETLATNALPTTGGTMTGDITMTGTNRRISLTGSGGLVEAYTTTEEATLFAGHVSTSNLMVGNAGGSYAEMLTGSLLIGASSELVNQPSLSMLRLNSGINGGHTTKWDWRADGSVLLGSAGDVNLYRGGANQLRTDDQFAADTVLLGTDAAYGGGWSTSLLVPTRNAVYNEMELRAPKANPTFTGTVTVPAGSFANAALANMAADTIKGRANAAGTGAPQDLTAAQIRTIINVEDDADVTDATNVAAAGAVMDTGDETVAGVKTFSSDPLIPDEVYDATDWNGSLEPPTKNAVRAKIETLATAASLTTHDADAAAHSAAFDAFSAGQLEHSPNYLSNYMVMYDDFLSNNTNTNQIGSLGWTKTLVGGGTVLAPTVGSVGALGIVTCGTSAVSDLAVINLQAGILQGAPEFIFAARILVNNTGSKYMVGLMDVVTGVDPGYGAWLELDSGVDTNFHARSRNNGAIADTSLGAATNGAWHIIEIACDGGGNLTFTLNGGSPVTHTTVPSGSDNMTPAVLNLASANSTRNLRVDWAYLKVAR